LTVTVCPATVSVPFRAAPGFAATLNRTDPLPLPLAPEVMVSHDGALLAAVQAQVAGPVTVTVWLVAPPAGGVNVNGLTVRLHSNPAWLTVTVCPFCPPIINVPLRDDDPVLVVKLNPTAAFPEPFAPEVTVIHGAKLSAAQLQDDPLVTFTVRLPAAALTSNEVGVAVTEHAGGAAA